MESRNEVLTVRLQQGIWRGQWYFEVIDTEVGVRIAYNKYPLTLTEVLGEINECAERFKGTPKGRRKERRE